MASFKALFTIPGKTFISSGHFFRNYAVWGWLIEVSYIKGFFISELKF